MTFYDTVYAASYERANESDITDDKEGFTLVQRRRKKPKRCEAGSGSDSFIIENEAPSAPRFSVIFSAGVPVSTCN